MLLLSDVVQSTGLTRIDLLCLGCSQMLLLSQTVPKYGLNCSNKTSKKIGYN